MYEELFKSIPVDYAKPEARCHINFYILGELGESNIMDVKTSMKDLLQLNTTG